MTLWGVLRQVNGKPFSEIKLKTFDCRFLTGHFFLMPRKPCTGLGVVTDGLPISSSLTQRTCLVLPSPFPSALFLLRPLILNLPGGHYLPKWDPLCGPSPPLYLFPPLSQSHLCCFIVLNKPANGCIRSLRFPSARWDRCALWHLSL